MALYIRLVKQQKYFVRIDILTFQYKRFLNIIFLDPASGGSDDWMYESGVQVVYTIEMRDTGFYNFLLPASQIKPNAEEVWNGISVILDSI